MKHALRLLSFLLLSIIATQARGQAPTAGLVGYYPFNQTQGTSVPAAGGQFKAGTTSGGVWLPTGGYNGGGALELTGDASVTLPVQWQPTAFTISWWTNPTSRYEWSQHTGPGDWGPFLFHSSYFGELYVGTDYYTRIALVNQEFVQIGKWQHFVFSFDQGTGKLYRNGMLLSQRTGMTPPAAWPQFTLSGEQRVDELRLYNRAITDQEALALYGLTPARSQVADSVELRVLRHFYYKTGGDQWNNRTGWPTTPAAWQAATLSSAANWFGITVTGGDVTALMSPANNLRNTLPDDLGDLRQLTSLEIGNVRQLTGALPPTFYQLTELTCLRLVSTNLNGHLSPAIGQLKKLNHFSLFNSQFSGPLPRELGQLTELTYILLGNHNRTTPDGQGNQFSGSLPKELGQLKNLLYLGIADKALVGTIPPELGNLRKLTYMGLDDASLRGTIPATLLQMPSLQVLNLSGNFNRLTKLPGPDQVANKAGFSLYVNNNQLNFADLEPHFTGPGQHPYQNFGYTPQFTPPGTDTAFVVRGATVTLRRDLGGQRTRYQWERQLTGGGWVELSGQTSVTLQLASVQEGNEGVYRTRATNDYVTGLTLYSKPVYVSLLPYAPLPTNEPAPVPAVALRGQTPASRATAQDLVNYVRTYTPRIGLTDLANLSSATPGSSAPAGGGTGTGGGPAPASGLLREQWDGVPGSNVGSLPLNAPPTSTGFVEQFASPKPDAYNYGARLRGYVTAPQTGFYTFWVAADDTGELWLSPDQGAAAARRIAYSPGWTQPGQWTKFSEQQSDYVYLAAGQRYYIEARHKQDGGGVHLGVRWQLPDGTIEEPLAGARLRPYDPAGPNPAPAATVSNGGFETPGASAAVLPGWQTTYGAGSPTNAAYRGDFPESHAGEYHVTHYQREPYEAYTYQRVEGLTPGYYTARVWVQTTGGHTAAYLRAGAPGSTLRQAPITQTPGGVGGPWQVVELLDVEVTAGTCEVGVYSRSSGNTSLYFDDVELVRQSTLLRNGSFEVDGASANALSGWQTTYGAGSPTDAAYRETYPTAHAGQYHATHYQGRAYEAYTYQTARGLPAGRYSARVRVKTEGGQTAAYLRVRGYGGADRQVALPPTPGGLGGRWQPIELTNIEVSSGQCEVGVYSQAAGGKSLYFDDVELVRQPAAAGDGSGDGSGAAPVAAGWNRAELQVKTEYLDGLGRPIQTVLHEQSPQGRDLVQPVAYDALGRQPKQYLPYAATTSPETAGRYRPDALREQDLFYRQGTQVPGLPATGIAYAETMFEASPLNRVTNQGAPGETWDLRAADNHAVSFLERPNSLALGDSVRRLTPGYGTQREELTDAGWYGDGELWVKLTRDEQQQWARTYTDKQGQVVLKQVALKKGSAPGDWLSTYYVFDDFDRLRAVLPPKAVQLIRRNSWRVTGAGVERLLFRSHHDGRGRLIEKLVPDQDGYQYTVYDQLDRPVLTQDAAQRASQQWLATKYDALGRGAYSALVTRSGQSREQLQGAADAAGKVYEQPTTTPLAVGGTSRQPVYYSNQAFPAVTGSDQLLTVRYYDGYDFDQNGTADLSYATNQATPAQLGGPVAAADSRVQGLPTRQLVRVLGTPEAEAGAWLTTTTFYDEKARPVQVVSTNARGGTDVTSTRYDFVGQALSSYSRHQVPGQPALAVQQSTSYDPAGRVLSTQQTLEGGAPEPLARHAYNELGQLSQKVLGARLQTVDYRYNIRGWLTHLNDPDQPDPQDLWSLQLSYEQGFNQNQFAGNLSGQRWRSRADGIERAYGYGYDALSRLLQGDYVARTLSGPTTTVGQWSQERGNYRLWATSYDAAGNIQTLRRRGLVAQGTSRTPAQFAETDNLRYRYAPVGGSEPVSNRLLRVDDLAPAVTSFGPKQPERPDFSDGPTSGATTPDYAYDAAGSLTSDKNKQITSISYNYQHLPVRLVWSSGDALEYRYAATGQKVAKLATAAGKPTVRTDYLGAWQYERDTLRWLTTSEGRMLRLYERDAANQVQVRSAYEYSIKDHLGNLRLAFRRGETKTYWAFLENDPAQLRREQREFDSLSVSAPIRTQVGHQYARSGEGVARLSAGGNQPTPLGPLKQLSVGAGDTVTVTAYGLYQQPVRSGSWAFSLAGFLASLRPTPGSPALESGYYRRSRALPLLSVGLALAPALPVFAATVPHAYLRVLVYNADSVLVDSRTVGLSSAAKDNYEQLQQRVIVPQGGAYVLAYVGNESEETVYFDDISVEHRPGLLVQETQYDPYGLELAGLSRTRAPETLNKYTFNGKEKQSEFGLGWHDHGWRFYDPALGRWVVSDPDAEEGDQFGWGTYQFGMDNAVRYNDLDGLCPTCEQDGHKADNIYALGATIESQGRTYKYTGNGTYGETLGSKIVSANATFDASLEGHSNPTNNEVVDIISPIKAAISAIDSSIEGDTPSKSPGAGGLGYTSSGGRGEDGKNGGTQDGGMVDLSNFPNLVPGQTKIKLPAAYESFTFGLDFLQKVGNVVGADPSAAIEDSKFVHMGEKDAKSSSRVLSQDTMRGTTSGKSGQEYRVIYTRTISNNGDTINDRRLIPTRK